MKQTTKKTIRLARLAGLCALGFVVSGCGSSGGSSSDLDRPLAVSPEEAARMRPRRLVVHPLTRIGLDAQGQPSLILQLEVEDGFSQTVKALGVLRVELYRPGGLASEGAGAGGAGRDTATWSSEDRRGGGDRTAPIQVEDRVWTVDLRSPDRNALLFDDLVTRTYTVPLGGLPDWLVAWWRGDSRVNAATPTVVLTYTIVAAGEADVVLRAAYRLSR